MERVDITKKLNRVTLLLEPMSEGAFRKPTLHDDIARCHLDVKNWAHMLGPVRFEAGREKLLDLIDCSKNHALDI